MTDLLAPEAPAISPESLGLATAPAMAHVTPPDAHTAAPAPAPDATDARRVRKTPEERIAELNAQFLKVHKTLAPVSERRQDALEALDPLRDRVRVALGKLSLADAEVDGLIEGFVVAGIAAKE